MVQLNSFVNTQWCGLAMNDPSGQNISIALQDEWQSSGLNLIFSPPEVSGGAIANEYNFAAINRGTPEITLGGTYYVGINFTADGNDSTNENLQMRFAFQPDGLAAQNSQPCKWENKGGNKWHINNACIMDFPNAVTVNTQWKNEDSDENFTISKASLIIVKLI